MWSTFILSMLSPSFTLAQTQYQNNNPVVDLGYARYSGLYNATSDINSWYGMRYAQAPIGNLRWQAPVDIESTNNYSATQTMDASKPGPLCMQGYPGWYGKRFQPGETETEDCLLLDVIAPAKPVPSRLPVMVQIHGGGYTTGSSQPGPGPIPNSAPGNALVYQSRGNLIYVTIQYRLGAYGFLGGSEVSANGATNAGLLDQRAAFMWVQRHIDKFGGDPSKVTIIGGSAGAGAVMAHMILYGGASDPPFRAAIAEYPWMQPYRNASNLEKQYDALRGAANCSDLECLRQISATDLRSAADQSYETAYLNGEYGYGDYFFGPYVDGSTVRDLPSNEFKLGHFAKVPLLTSREGYEGVSFTNLTQTNETKVEQDLENLFPFAKQSFFSRLSKLYPRSAFNTTVYRRAALFGDAVVACPSSHFAAMVSDYGMPAWKMVFYAGSETHGAILPFVETVNLQGTSNNATLASVMRNYYISFAASLDPNAIDFTNVSQPKWPQYQTPGVEGFKVLNITHLSVGTSPDLDVRPQCDFFNSQSNVVRN